MMNNKYFITICGENCVIRFDYLSMSMTQVYISAKKRVGQTIVWSSSVGKHIEVAEHKDYSTMNILVMNYEFGNEEINLCKYLMETISFIRHINLDSHRASYELLRALS